MIDRFRVRPSWLFVLPAIVLGASLERGSGSTQPPCPISAPAEIHYSPGEDLETIDVALMRSAKRQVDIAAYVLTDRAIVEALRQARGVKVRVWRDASEAARLSDYDVEAQLGGHVPGLEIRSNSPGRDGATLRTSSANFSHSGERFQDNDLVTLRGASVCAGFDAKFDRAWAQS